MSTTHFFVGDEVVIRYGLHQGQKATIIKTIPADGFKVKTDAGYVLFYSGKGLEMAPALELSTSSLPATTAPSRRNGEAKQAPIPFRKG
jgi:hypothetical protein